MVLAEMYLIKVIVIVKLSITDTMNSHINNSQSYILVDNNTGPIKGLLPISAIF